VTSGSGAMSYRDFESKYQLKACVADILGHEIKFSIRNGIEDAFFWAVVPPLVNTPQCFVIPSLRKLKIENGRASGFQDSGLAHLFNAEGSMDFTRLQLGAPAIFEYENGYFVGDTPIQKGALR